MPPNQQTCKHTHNLKGTVGRSEGLSPALEISSPDAARNETCILVGYYNKRGITHETRCGGRREVFKTNQDRNSMKQENKHHCPATETD